MRVAVWEVDLDLSFDFVRPGICGIVARSCTEGLVSKTLPEGLGRDVERAGIGGLGEEVFSVRTAMAVTEESRSVVGDGMVILRGSGIVIATGTL